MEIKKEVKTFNVDYICDSCGQGKMRPNGTKLACNPPIFEHICNNCNQLKDFRCKYPQLKVEEIQ